MVKKLWWHFGETWYWWQNTLILKNATKDITEYPVAELIVASGFFIVLSLEQIVMGVCVAKNENKKKNKKEHGHEHKNHDSGKTKTDDSRNRF